MNPKTHIKFDVARRCNRLHTRTIFRAIPRWISLLSATLLVAASSCYRAPHDTTYTPKTDAVNAYNAAQAALEAGRADEALSQARAAVEADPDYGGAAWLLASLLGRAGRYDEALTVCTALTKRSPNFVQAHLLQGILGDKSGDSKAANAGYDAALRCFAAMPLAQRNQPETALQEAVAIFLRRGKLEGIKAINRVLSVYPDYDTALYVKACMQDKDRGFLLRWFSERRPGPSPVADNPGKPRNPTDNASAPARP